MGLEALESPLATRLGVTVGAEETTGKCSECGFVYTVRKTVLNGVRAYIRGEKHPEVASSPEREAEWKQINKLRHALFHSLTDVGRDTRESVCRTPFSSPLPARCDLLPLAHPRP